MMKRTFLFPALILIAGALAWSAWWYYTGQIALRALDEWAVAQRLEGYSISHNTPSLSGFPGVVAITVAGIEGSAPGGLWSITGDGLKASFQPWDLRTIDVEGIGTLSVQTPTIPGSMEKPVQIGALFGQYRQDLELGRHEADLILQDVSGPRGFQAQEVAFVGRQPFAVSTTSEDPVGDIRLEAVGVTLPAGGVPEGLPNTVEAALLSAEISGPELSELGSPAKRLIEWQAAGGKVDISEIALVWQDLTLEGDGIASVDAYLRPELSLSLQVGGLSEMAQRFEEAGLITRTARQAIELGASLLSFGSGGSGKIKVPVSIQEGEVFIGPARVGEVQQILPGPAPPVRLRPVDRVIPAPGEPELPPPPPSVSEETLRAQ